MPRIALACARVQPPAFRSNHPGSSSSLTKRRRESTRRDRDTERESWRGRWVEGWGWGGGGERARDTARARDDYRCRCCGQNQSEHEKQLDHLCRWLGGSTDDVGSRAGGEGWEGLCRGSVRVAGWVGGWGSMAPPDILLCPVPAPFPRPSVDGHGNGSVDR